jgi:hypothetical protein
MTDKLIKGVQIIATEYVVKTRRAEEYNAVLE